MQSVGTEIRKARLQVGFNLNQVSAHTCIPVKILQAIEADDLSQISSAFFYKSFVRQFANQVGISYESLAEPIAVAVSRFPEPLVPGQEQTLLRRSLVKPLRRPRNLRWLYPAASFAFVLVACCGLYAYWENFKLNLSTSLIKPVQMLASSPFKESKNAPPPLAGPVANSGAAVPAEPDGTFRVELSAVERTWLSIRADGKQVYSGTLEVDQRKLLEGRQEGQMRTGNAGGINIVFNGRPIGVAGPHGSVRTVVFTKDNYQVLQPAPVHAALAFPAFTFQPFLRPLPH